MNKKPFFALLAVLLLWSMAAAQAVQRQEDPSESQVRDIAKGLRCAVCQNQSIYESNADLAKDMLRIIRDKVRTGETDGAIRDYFLRRYGDYIYLEPTKQGVNWILWVGPFLGLALGGWALAATLRQWKKTGSSQAEGEPEVGAQMKARIRRELDRFQL